MLWAKQQVQFNGRALWYELNVAQCVALVAVSIGLYGFGMSLNDIIDRRRDRQMSPHRPLPSGRIGLRTALTWCWRAAGGNGAGRRRDLHQCALERTAEVSWLVVFTGAMIVFYDFAAKYLVPLGLLSLGLIRFFHATIAAPSLPVLWQPLLLMNHVTIVSTLAYHWEHKRPALRPVHWWSVFLGLGLVDALAIGLVWWRRHHLATAMPGGILAIRPCCSARWRRLWRSSSWRSGFGGAASIPAWPARP